MLMPIRRAAQECGCSTYSLRRWERLGLTKEIGRTFSGQRLYTEADIVAIKRFLKKEN